MFTTVGGDEDMETLKTEGKTKVKELFEIGLKAEVRSTGPTFWRDKDQKKKEKKKITLSCIKIFRSWW